MDIQEIEIDKIIPYINNPRKNLNVDKVASSIKEFGFQQPIVVDKTNTIVVGHTRYEAAKKLGITKVPVQIADLSENQAKAYRIADNRLNQDASWDTKLLNIEFNDLLSKDYNLDSLGFTTDELDTLFLKSSEDADIGLNENIEEDLDLTQETLSDVKMIQLFFNAENESKFRDAVSKVSKENNIDNISDAVLRCVLNEANKT